MIVANCICPASLKGTSESEESVTLSTKELNDRDFDCMCMAPFYKKYILGFSFSEGGELIPCSEVPPGQVLPSSFQNFARKKYRQTVCKEIMTDTVELIFSDLIAELSNSIGKQAGYLHALCQKAWKYFHK